MINFQFRPFFCVSVCLDTQEKLDQIRESEQLLVIGFGTWEATVPYCTSQCRFLQGPRWSWVTYSGIPCPVLWSWPSKVNSKNWNPKPWIVPQIVPNATVGCLCGTQSLWRARGFPTAMRFQPIYIFCEQLWCDHTHPQTPTHILLTFMIHWVTEFPNKKASGFPRSPKRRGFITSIGEAQSSRLETEAKRKFLQAQPAGILTCPISRWVQVRFFSPKKH